MSYLAFDRIRVFQTYSIFELVAVLQCSPRFFSTYPTLMFFWFFPTLALTLTPSAVTVTPKYVYFAFFVCAVFQCVMAGHGGGVLFLKRSTCLYSTSSHIPVPNLWLLSTLIVTLVHPLLVLLRHPQKGLCSMPQSFCGLGCGMGFLA